MFSHSPFKTFPATDDERLPHMLLGPNGVNRVRPLSKPELWQLESSLSPIDLHNSRACGNPIAKIGNEKVTKEVFLNSELPDDIFFRLYADQNGSKGNKNEPFPLKLYRIIFEAEKNCNQDIISFCPDGRSFMIHKIDAFVTKIMPKYFTANRMASFQRQLNLYGFSKILRGPDKGGFSHNAFSKNQRNHCLTIKRKTQALKVPPHLLKEPTAESPSAGSSPRGNNIVGHDSPLIQALAHVASESPVKSASKPDDALSSLANSSGVSTRFPTLPSLMMCKDLRRSLQEPRLAIPAPRLTAPSTTSELFILKHQIILAKERSIMRQQMALTAIDRLVIRAMPLRGTRHTW